MLYTKETVKANLRNRDGKRVLYLEKGDQMTSDARDFLNREHIAVLPAEQAKPERYRLLGGGYCEGKPEHLTHLNAETLVPKTHPRICFRGQMDLLEAELLLCAQAAQGTLRTQLGQVLEHARTLIRCDVLGEPVPDTPLCGLSQDALRERSHFPQKYYAQPHFMPSDTDSALLLLVNRARCVARSAELAAAAAFCDADGVPVREDILRAMNRLSSMLYLIMIEEKSGKTEPI